MAIDGRKEDYVVLKNGAQIGRMDHVFKDMLNIREAQIRQSRPGRIIIHIVKNDLYGDQDEHLLRRELAQRVGNDMDVDLFYVDALERTGAGKLRFVVSELPK